jgi:hypothetical protein
MALKAEERVDRATVLVKRCIVEGRGKMRLEVRRTGGEEKALVASPIISDCNFGISVKQGEKIFRLGAAKLSKDSVKATGHVPGVYQTCIVRRSVSEKGNFRLLTQGERKLSMRGMIAGRLSIQLEKVRLCKKKGFWRRPAQ